MHWIDAESLPEVAGTVERFVVNPHGEVDGFVMTDERRTHILVHTPPHMEGELTRHVKAGDKCACAACGRAALICLQPWR